jgi:hypothetical protein
MHSKGSPRCDQTGASKTPGGRATIADVRIFVEDALSHDNHLGSQDEKSS